MPREHGPSLPALSDGPSTPNPGSAEAIAAGCKCPRMDNWNGDPELGRIRGFVVTSNCNLHWKDDECL